MLSSRRYASAFIAAVRVLACLFVMQASAAVAAANGPLEAGAPLLRTFDSNDYGGALQNWAVVQDHRGLIYVGNVEDGVLEYDGARWRRIATPNNTTIRSLAVDRTGRVYVGGVGELGYLAPDATGRMQYVSLLGRIPERDRDFADVWRTFATPEGVYFSTFKRLIRISADEVRIWNSSSTFHLSYRVHDSLFIRETGRGLLRLVGDELQPIAHGERFADERVYAILPWPEASHSPGQALLIGTRTQGWFVLDGASLQRWTTEADAAIDEALLYGARWLKSGALAIGTLHGGVFLLDRQGRSLGRLDKSMDLPSETVFDLFEDRQGGLWLALDSGIARVDLAGPLTGFERRSGIEGGVMAIHRHAGSLYVGTSQGLYRLAGAGPGAAHFVKVPEIQGQTWALAAWRSSLLIANIQGVFELRDGVYTLVRPSQQVTTALLPSGFDDSRVFVGMLNGLASMRFENGRWVDEGAVPELADEVRTMAEDDEGRLWVGAATTGVFRLQSREDSANPGQAGWIIERFGAQHGLPRIPHHVYDIGGAISISTHKGIVQFDEDARRFIPDARFASMFAPEPRLAFPVAADNQGRVWMHTTNESRTIKEAGFATPQQSQGYGWDPRPTREIAGNNIAAIYADQDGVVWFGGDEAVYRHDSTARVDYSGAERTLVREVATRDGRLLHGGAGEAEPPRLAFSENALRFEFSAPSFGAQPNRFQALLEGADEDWSAWSTETYRDYTNIHEGTYRFRVRAMNAFGAISPEAVYSIRILPPWYRTWFAYASYLVLAAVLFAGISRWRSEALSRRNQELAALVAKRTEELSGANEALRDANTALADLSVTDTLTGLRNRRYLVDHIERDVAMVRGAHQEIGPRGEASGEGALLFVVVDIDHFKHVNDHYGHVAGDRVLEQFARILQSACRETDTAVRWGGEEFMIVGRCMSPDAGAAIAERIRSMVAAHIFVLDDGKTLRRTCSVGFASYPVFSSAPDRFGWEDAVKLADQCLYEVKRSGRNGWAGVEPGQAPPAWDDPDLDLADLPSLIERGFLRMRRTALRIERRTSAA